MNTLIYITLAGLIVLAFWFFKNRTKKSIPSSTTTSTPAGTAPTTGTPKSVLSRRKQFSEPLGAVLIAGAAYVIWVIYRTWHATANAIADFKVNWLGAALTITVLAIVVEIWLSSKYNSDDKKNASGWKEKWKIWRGKVGFAILWTIIVYLVNVSLRHLDSGFWLSLWNYKGVGTWFFYLVMTLLTVGIWLAVNMDGDDQKKIRNCGKILFLIGMASWVTVWVKSDYKKIPDLDIAASRPQTIVLPPPPVMVDAPPIVVEKGQWSHVYKPSDIVDVTGGGKGRVAYVYGDGVSDDPEKECPAGRHIELPQGTTRVKFKSDESDMQIIVQVPRKDS